MKAVVAAFNQEKALVGAFSVITNLRMELFEAPVGSSHLVTTSLILLQGNWFRVPRSLGVDTADTLHGLEWLSSCVKVSTKFCGTQYSE